MNINIKGVKRRLYADFFRPSKEADYERIIKIAKDKTSFAKAEK